jgi:hypothetical protein
MRIRKLGDSGMEISAIGPRMARLDRRKRRFQGTRLQLSRGP